MASSTPGFRWVRTILAGVDLATDRSCRLRHPVDLLRRQDRSRQGVPRPLGRRRSKLMRADLITSVAVKTKARTRVLAIVRIRAHDFDQSLKTAEHRRRHSAQVDQDLVVHQRFGDMIDDNWRNRCEPVTAAAMRYESRGRRAPDQFAELLSCSGIRREQ